MEYLNRQLSLINRNIISSPLHFACRNILHEAVSNSDDIMSKCQMVKLVISWNGCGRRRPLSKLKHYSGNYLQRLRITMKTVGAPAYIRTRYIWTTSQKHYHLSHVAFSSKRTVCPQKSFSGGKKCTAITSLIECGIVLVWNLGALISKMLYLRGCLNKIFQQHPLVQLNSLISDQSVNRLKNTINLHFI